MKSIMCRIIDFLRHVVDEVEEVGSLFAYVCEHGKMFLVEDFLREK